MVVEYGLVGVDEDVFVFNIMADGDLEESRPRREDLKWSTSFFLACGSRRCRR